MQHDKVQTLNYCAHAIEDLKVQLLELRGLAPASAHMFVQVIRMLERSVKFILPNRCNLIDADELRQAHLDMVRLPFPCVAFEAPWEMEDGEPLLVGEFAQTPASRRIALCWDAVSEIEPLPGLNDILHVCPGGGVFVLPIFWTARYWHWTMSMGGSFVPYDNEACSASVLEARPASRLAVDATIAGGLAKEGALTYRAEPFIALPEMFDQAMVNYGGNRHKAFAQIMLDSRDEAQMLIQACSIINCANVTTAEIAPAPALNKKRQANGKQPFFTYKVLQLTAERKSSAGNGSGAGGHASPRMHLRRGHLRRLEDRTIWVRPAMVNANVPSGVVVKDYAVVDR